MASVESLNKLLGALQQLSVCSCKHFDELQYLLCQLNELRNPIQINNSSNLDGNVAGNLAGNVAGNLAGNKNDKTIQIYTYPNKLKLEGYYAIDINDKIYNLIKTKSSLNVSDLNKSDYVGSIIISNDRYIYHDSSYWKHTDGTTFSMNNINIDYNNFTVSTPKINPDNEHIYEMVKNHIRIINKKKLANNFSYDDFIKNYIKQPSNMSEIDEIVDYYNTINNFQKKLLLDILFNGSISGNYL